MKILFFDSVLILCLILGLVGVVFGLHYIYSNREWGIVVLLGSGTFIIISIISLLCKREIRTNIAMIFIASCSGIFLFNLTLEITKTDLRPINPSYRMLKVTKSLGIALDIRSANEVILDMRALGELVYPYYSPSKYVNNPSLLLQDQLFPLGSISSVLTLLCNENGPYITNYNDRFGFNNDDRVYDRAGERWLLVGDSFTHGYCVQQDDTIAGVLRKRGLNAISIGVIANGPLRELASLKEYGSHLKPKVVLWFFYGGNDFQDLQLELKVPALLQYLNNPSHSQNLVNRQREIDTFHINKAEKIDRIPLYYGKYIQNDKEQEDTIINFLKGVFTLHRFRQLIGLSYNFYTKGLSKDKRSLLPTIREIMVAAKNTTASWGGEIYFVYLPQIGKRHNEYDEVRVIIEELGIKFINFSDIHNSYKEEINTLTSTHYNETGYKLLADFVHLYITQNRNF